MYRCHLLKGRSAKEKMKIIVCELDEIEIRNLFKIKNLFILSKNRLYFDSCGNQWIC